MIRRLIASALTFTWVLAPHMTSAETSGGHSTKASEAPPPALTTTARAESAAVLGRSVSGNGGAIISGTAYRMIGTLGQPFVHPIVTNGPEPLTNRLCSGWWCIEVGFVVSAPDLAPPGQIEFGLPHPNPSSGDMRLLFALPRAARVEADLIDVAGRRVRSLVGQDFEAGRHDLTWNGLDGAGHRVHAGVYFLRVRVDGKDTSRRRVVVVR